MLRPSGSAPMTTTSAPACRSARGAAALAAPCAQSTTTFSPSSRFGQAGQEAGDVPVGGVRERRGPGPRPAPVGRCQASPQAALDGVLDVVGELVPALGEELDAVVRHGVVGRREHDAEVGVRVGDEGGDAGRGDHAGVVDVDARAREARDDGGGEELARRAGVTADDRSGPVPRELADLAEHVRGGHGEVERQLGGDLPVRHPPDAVGAEEPPHNSSWVCASGRGRGRPPYEDPPIRRYLPDATPRVPVAPAARQGHHPFGHTRPAPGDGRSGAGRVTTGGADAGGQRSLC